jgi:hypothetical protein
MLPALLPAIVLAAPESAVELDAAGVVAVEVDMIDLPTRAELQQNLALELRRRLAAEPGEVPAGAVLADDRLVSVELWPGPIPDSGDVLIRVGVRFGGETLAESEREICLACNDAQVADRALAMLLPLLPYFPEPPRAKPNKQQDSAPAPVSRDTTLGDERTRRKPARPLLISGAVSLGVGIAALAGGVTLTGMDERVVSPAGAAELEVIKYREPGIALATVGGVVTVTGAVLLGLAFRTGPRQVAVIPALSPSFVGVGAVGRF